MCASCCRMLSIFGCNAGMMICTSTQPRSLSLSNQNGPAAFSGLWSADQGGVPKQEGL